MEQEIKRRELIRVATADIKEKEYQGKVTRYLEFTTKNGATWKITEKRQHLWEIFTPGAAVEISIAEFKNRDYIAHAELNLAPPSEEPPIQAELENARAREKQILQAETPHFDPQELGMWFKEAGLGLRSGYIKTDTATGKAIELAYKLRMLQVMGIKPVEK